MIIYKRRAKAVLCSIFAVCIYLAWRLYSLGTGDNPAMQVLSGQYVRKNVVAEHGGFVYGCDGMLLSHYENGALAIVNPGLNRDRNRVVSFLSDNSDMGADEIIDIYEKNKPFVMTLDRNSDKNTPDGVYVYPAFASRENGFLRHILGYRNGDGVGIAGIYGRFDGILSEFGGTLSYKYSSDAMGGLLEGDDFSTENDGYTDLSGLVLTVDSGIQAKVDGICDDYMDMGAVIITELSTGNLVAISSRPLYDSERVSECFDSQRGELINRAFALYTPGSVFKAVVAAAALEYDTGLYGFEYECTGECDVSGKIFKCHKTEGHGVQDMKSAFANSCNTYFIQLAEKTGFEYICFVAKKMGLGNINVIDGMYVKQANVPDPVKNYPDAYKANFSFGQGDLLLSPVDVLNVYSICATGVKKNFSLLYGFYNGRNDEIITFEQQKDERVLQNKTVILMRLMMRECVMAGTGKEAFIEATDVGGKTATAQSGQYKDEKEVLHRWFAGVYPINSPKYAIVVLCDGNGENLASPAKIFSLCVEAMMEDK